MSDTSVENFSTKFAEALDTKISKTEAENSLVKKSEYKSSDSLKFDVYAINQVYTLFNNYSGTDHDYREYVQYVPSETDIAIYDFGIGYNGE